MEFLKIKGKAHLEGIANIHGAKNSVLPILAATVLVKGVSVIHNCPNLSDVNTTIDILRHLGAKVDRQDDTIVVDSSTVTNYEVPEELMKEMRSSIIFLGSISCVMGKAVMFLPGGCEIGLRPIDMHLKALNELGYATIFDGNNIICDKLNVVGKRVVLPFPSVGATENIILASCLSVGTTYIVNAAREPEIVDLVDFLNKAGARISGAGSTVIRIDGVSSLISVEHKIIPDRILATTIMSASVITNSQITLENVCIYHLMPVIPAFKEIGCEFNFYNNKLDIIPPRYINPIRKIKTLPYPGFPTDCQAPIMACLTVANGTSVICETIFESRYKHIPQLNRFGADITVHDKIALVNGVKELHCANASCTDLRGGAAVVICALGANGESLVSNIYHIDRGYENIENQFAQLGADIKRFNDEKEGQQKSK